MQITHNGRLSMAASFNAIFGHRKHYIMRAAHITLSFNHNPLACPLTTKYGNLINISSPAEKCC